MVRFYTYINLNKNHVSVINKAPDETKDQLFTWPIGACLKRYRGISAICSQSADIPEFCSNKQKCRQNKTGHNEKRFMH
jgi:hypothetical protein